MVEFPQRRGREPVDYNFDTAYGQYENVVSAFLSRLHPQDVTFVKPLVESLSYVNKIRLGVFLQLLNVGSTKFISQQFEVLGRQTFDDFCLQNKEMIKSLFVCLLKQPHRYGAQAAMIMAAVDLRELPESIIRRYQSARQINLQSMSAISGIDSLCSQAEGFLDQHLADGHALCLSDGVFAAKLKDFTVALSLKPGLVRTRDGRIHGILPGVWYGFDEATRDEISLNIHMGLGRMNLGFTTQLRVVRGLNLPAFNVENYERRIANYQAGLDSFTPLPYSVDPLIRVPLHSDQDWETWE